MKYDAVIIGGGPAGISCAKLLTEHGKKVLLLDKGMGRKVCAGGLSHKVISFINIPDELIEKQFYDVTIGACGKNGRMHFPVPIVSTVSRNRFTEWHLAKLEGSGAEIVDDVKEVRIGAGFVVYDGKKADYSYLVGADGGHSLVRRHLGLRTRRYLNAIQCRVNGDYPNIEMHVMTRPLGYYWVFPHVGHAYFGVGGKATDVSLIKLKGMLSSFLRRRGLKGTDYSGGIINYDYQGYRFGNVFLAGEAAGLTSAISAEGIFFALVSGHEVAKEIIKPGYNSVQLRKVIRKIKTDRLALAFLSFVELIGLDKQVIPWFLRWKYKAKMRKLRRIARKGMN